MKKLIILGLIVFVLGFFWQVQSMSVTGCVVTPASSTVSYGSSETFEASVTGDPLSFAIIWYVDNTVVFSDYLTQGMVSYYTTDPYLDVGAHTIAALCFDQYTYEQIYSNVATLTVISGSPTPTPTAPPYPTPTPSPTPSPTPQPTPSPNPDPDKINVIVNPSNGGLTTPAVGFYEYEVGQSLTFTAVADENYHFLHWELSDGMIKLANPYVMTATVDFSIKAVFEADLPPEPEMNTLEIYVTAGGTTEPAPGSYNITVGETKVVTAKPDSEYLLDYWLFNNGTKVRGNPISIYMDKAYSVRAAFYKFVPAPNVNGSNAEEWTSPWVPPSKIILPGGGSLDLGIVVMTVGGLVACVGVFHEVVARKSKSRRR